MAAALSIEQLFDSVAIRIDGLRAASERIVIHWDFTDSGTLVRTTLSNGVLVQTESPRSSVDPDLTLTLTKMQLLGILGGGGLDGVEHTGDPAVLWRLVSYIDDPDPAFPIVTP